MREAVHGSDPLALYRAAQRAGSPMSGSYHRNVRVQARHGPVLVRIPLPGADQMDLRVWPEWEVLGVVAQYVEQVPRLLHVCADPPFQIHEFVRGGRLNELAPRGHPVPPEVIPGVLALFDQLAGTRGAALPPLPASWPSDGDCPAFAELVSGATQRIYDAHRDEFGDLFAALGIPEDPLAPVVAAWPELARRPFRMLHADVHRRNILLASSGAVFLDWELALWGDPLYDLAVHLNKMTYLAEERRALLRGWAARTDPAGSRPADLTAYLRHEQVKAAIVHSIRYTRQILAGTTTATTRHTLVHKLTHNLNAARRTWSRPAPLTTEHVERLILSQSGCRLQ